MAAFTVLLASCVAGGPAQANVYVGQLGNGPGDYTYTVPAGLTSLTVVLVGAGGGSIDAGIVRTGGGGAFLQGTIAVSPGQQFSAEIGGQGAADGTGGFGGGADGGSGTALSGAGGGGATSISLDGVPILVAAGGGGASYGYDGGNSGLPGHETTWALNGQPGGAASQTAGGAGGAGGLSAPGSCTDEKGNLPADGLPGIGGSLGHGGTGGSPEPTVDTSANTGPSDPGGGGGGGGGYYGGGGGGGASSCPQNPSIPDSGGGGGGSSYADPRVSDVYFTEHTSDHAGSGMAEVVYHDSTPPFASPTLSPPANSGGWNNTDVRVDWNWQDDLAGIHPQHCGRQSSSAGEGVFTLSAACTDFALNQAQASLEVRIDKTAPRIAVKRPTHLVYELGDRVHVAYRCRDQLSGIANCRGSRADGQMLGTRRLGRHTFVVRAVDLAGNHSAVVVTYRVVCRPRQ